MSPVRYLLLLMIGAFSLACARDGWDPTHRVWTPGKSAKDGIASVTFSPDGKRMALGGREGSLTLWDWPTCKTGKVLQRPGVDISNPMEVFRLHGPGGHPLYSNQVAILAPVFSPSGRYLAAPKTSTKAAVGLWNTMTGDPIPLENPEHGGIWLAFSQDERFLFALIPPTKPGKPPRTGLRAWETATGKALPDKAPPLVNAESPSETWNFGFLPDRSYVTATRTTLTRVDAHTGRILAQSPAPCRDGWKLLGWNEVMIAGQTLLGLPRRGAKDGAIFIWGPDPSQAPRVMTLPGLPPPGKEDEGTLQFEGFASLQEGRGAVFRLKRRGLDAFVLEPEHVQLWHLSTSNGALTPLKWTTEAGVKIGPAIGGLPWSAVMGQDPSGTVHLYLWPDPGGLPRRVDPALNADWALAPGRAALAPDGRILIFDPERLILLGP
jgi:hypothetical protein